MDRISSAFRVTGSSGYVRWLAVVVAAMELAGCGGGGSGGQSPPPPASYTLGGTVSGLAADGLVLANNGATVTVNSGATTFSFATSLASGTAYAVTVQTSPNGLTCSVANGTGTIGSANVSNVVVTCSDKAYALGGTISGLNSSGLVLANGSDKLTVASGATSFTMPTPVAFTSSYQVTVATQPQGLSCSVQNGTGTMGAGAVTNVAVSCTDQLFTIGGSVTGLTVAGLVLANGSDTVQVPANASSFTFPTSLAFSSTYSVTVSAQPAGVMCTVSSGSGTVPAANVTNVAVVCSDKSYSLGGTVAGLTVSGLVLSNGSDTLTVAANAPNFTMPKAVAFTSHYSVTVSTQPAGETCSVSSGDGTMPASDVTNVMVTCATAAYTLGGTISGLTATGLILANGSDRLSVAANAAVFTMQTPVAYNSPYAVTVAAQPAGLMCSITGGSGTMPGTVVNSVQVSCSPRQWTWEGGPNTATPGPTGTQKGVYGTLGMADPANQPGARDNPMAWTDSSGNFWLFGGTAVDSAGTVGDINDLWSYDPNAQRWTWVGGANTVGSSGTYGAVGSAGVPAARHGGMTWTDTNGNLWLYGGSVPDPVDPVNNPPLFLNDLWSYNIASKTWTLVNGSNSTDVQPIYGSQGGAAMGNTPGGRLGAATWIDSAGHLWLFGGQTINASAQRFYFADLWSFDPGSKEWTWTSGSNVVSDPGTYGSKGTPSASNVPPSRYGAASWIDSHGALWLFGGGYTDPAGTTISGLNDLWVYTPSTGWDWVGGSNGVNGFGTYGTAGVVNASNVPGARGGSVVWTDNEGHVWLYGGVGVGATQLPTANQLLDDLWTFDPVSTQWTFVSGDQEPNATGGTYNLPGNGTSKPSGRVSSAAWADSSGHIWMFGGTGFDSAGTAADLNDLWTF